MDDRTKRTIDKYNSIAEEYAQKIEGRLLEKELNQFITLLKPGIKVLEVGSAAGRDANFLHSRGIDVIGMDLSEKLTEIAKRKYPQIKFQIADMRKLPFGNESFDGIWARAVFHHLEGKDMTPTLKEWNRILKQNGIIYIQTKEGKGNWKGKDELSVGQEREFTLLSQEQLDRMLTEAGFNKIKLEIMKDSTRDLYWLRAFYRKI